MLTDKPIYHILKKSSVIIFLVSSTVVMQY